MLNIKKVLSNAEEGNTRQKTVAKEQIQRVLSRLPDAEIRSGRSGRCREDSQAGKISLDAGGFIEGRTGNAAI